MILQDDLSLPYDWSIKGSIKEKLKMGSILKGRIQLRILTIREVIRTASFLDKPAVTRGGLISKAGPEADRLVWPTRDRDLPLRLA